MNEDHSRPLLSRFHGRRAILYCGIALAILVILSTAFFALLYLRQQAEMRAVVATQYLARSLELSLNGLIDTIDVALQASTDEIGRQISTGKLDRQTVTQFLGRQKDRLPYVTLVRASDDRGNVIFGRGVLTPPTNVSDRKFFFQLRDDPKLGLFVSEPLVARVDPRWVWPFARRINRPDGSFSGVAYASILIEEIDKIFAHIEMAPGGSISLRDSNMALIARHVFSGASPLPMGDRRLSSPMLEALKVNPAEGTYVSGATSIDNVSRTYSYRRSDKYGFTVNAGISSESVLAPWWNQVWITSGVVAALLLALFGFSWVIDRAWRRQDQDMLAVEANRASLQEAQLIAQLGNYVYDIAQDRWTSSAVLDQVFGIDQDYLRDAEHWIALVAPDSQDEMRDYLSSLITFRLPFDREYRIVRVCDSEERWVHGKGKLQLDSHGNPVCLVGTIQDITVRKLAEEELDKYRRHLEVLVEQRTADLQATEAKATHLLQSSADGLYGVDHEGRITFINSAACTMLGYTPDEVMGRHAHKLFHHSRLDGTPYPANECPCHSAVLGGREVRVDGEVYWHSDGHAIPVMYSAHPIQDKRVGSTAVISLVDMSEQRAAAQATEQARLAAERLAKVRSEFLANMSHEIRTPLNGVLGFAQIGQRNAHDAVKASNAFDKILSSGNLLLGVINEILDFSKIEAGKVQIERTPVSLVSVLDNTVELLAERAASKGLQLQVTRAADFPEACVSDQLRLSQVLLNLLSNAVKFTERGSVTLSATRRGNDLVFTITDTGIGMSAEQITRLFNPFQQADGSTTRRFGGTGLGLAISKRIVEMMGGEIRVESELGVGTTFEFFFPYEPVPDAIGLPSGVSELSVSKHGKPLAGISILVVEDEPINQFVIEENLTQDGAKVVMVSNGIEAVGRISLDGPQAYDVVLMDIQMPEMDGYEATRRIRVLAPDLPIIAQTAHASFEDRDKCLMMGMSAHIAKPIDPQKLVELVCSFVKNK